MMRFAWWSGPLCAIALVQGHAVAQHEAIDKGTLLIGGGAGISSSHQDGDAGSSFSISLAPTGGIFLVRGLAVSASVSFGHTSGGSSSTNTWGVGPSIAYYFATILGRAYPFVEVGSSVSWSSSHTDTFGGPQSFHLTYLALNPSVGLVFMLIPHVGIRGELYLLRRWTTQDPSTFVGRPATTVYGFSAGVTAFVF